MKAALGCFAALALLAAGPAHAALDADYFSNVELVTHEGETVRFYEDVLKGKTVAINVMFTACKDICPLETRRMVRLYGLLGDRVGKDIFFYSISLEPETDTPEVLKAYADKLGALLPGWTFLTGKPENIAIATKKLGLVRATDAATRDGHSAILMVGREATGQWDRMSALDEPRFTATRMASLLGWRDVLPTQTYAEARPLNLKAGQYVFRSRCGACHTIGQGDSVGPDLLGVTTRRERDWLTRYIRTPDEMLAEGDPIAVALFEKYNEVRMPKLHFAPQEVAAVIAYLDAQSSAVAQKAPEGTAEHQHQEH